MGRKTLGAVMVIGGIGVVLSLSGGASIFIGMAILCVGLLFFLGDRASSGGGASSGGSIGPFDGDGGSSSGDGGN